MLHLVGVLNKVDHLKAIISKNSRAYDTWAHAPLLSYPDNTSIIYVLDSGINLSHPEFNNSNISVLNDINENPNHGTQITSLIVGDTLGVAPTACVKFVGIKSEYDLQNAFELILADRKHNLDKLGIVLCAFQVTNNLIPSQIQNTYNSVKEHNSIIITSCGNSGKDDKWFFPATDTDSIVVGSHDVNGLISQFNSMSEHETPDVFAPGRKIRSASETGYTETSGTSNSAAIVAGCLSYYATASDPVLAFNNNLNDRVLCWKYSEFKHHRAQSCFIGVRSPTNILKCIPANQIGTITTDFDNVVTLFQDYNSDTAALSLKESCINAIKSIKHDSIIVPLSGGIDSEIVALTCLAAKKQFTPLIMRYIGVDGNILNDHDFVYAEKFCSSHNLTPVYVNLDIITFYETGIYYKYAQEYYASSPQLCAHLWMMDQVDGFFIFPGDPVSVSNRGIITSQPFTYYCYDYYFYKNNRCGIARLLTHDSDIVRSSVKLNINNLPGRTKYNRKVTFYNTGGYDVTAREEKYTGFEKIKKYYNDKYNVLRYYDNRFRSLLIEFSPHTFNFIYTGL